MESHCAAWPDSASHRDHRPGWGLRRESGTASTAPDVKDADAAGADMRGHRPPQIQPATLMRGLARSPRAVVGLGVMLALVMFALCALVLYQSRQDAFEHGRQTSLNVLLLAKRDIQRNFEIYALSLQAIVDSRQQPEIRALPRHLQQALLADRAVNAKYLGSIAVLDANGNLILDNRRGSEVHTGNFADRNYFQVQRDNPNAGLYISRPYLSRFRNGVPTISLSRRIENPDGSFAGVALIALDLSYFEDLFEGMALGPDGAISLVRTDGTLMMRVPYDPALVGTDMHDTTNFKRFSSQDSGTFAGTARIDDVPRLYVFDHIQGQPLILNVGMAQSYVYQAWRRRALLFGSLMLLFGLAFVGLSLMFAAQLRHRLSAEHELRRLARTDGLTGLVNRRTLDEILALEWRRAQRSGRPLAILFIDIDHFKAYNDHYGHQLGDQALISVGRSIAAQIHRPADLAARYGGEEFVVVLPDTPLDSAALLAEGIRAATAALAMPHARSDHQVVTVSIGVAGQDRGHWNDPTALLKAADDALYQAKAGGRNLVRIDRIAVGIL